jgi:hypothetical protein
VKNKELVELLLKHDPEAEVTGSMTSANMVIMGAIKKVVFEKSNPEYVFIEGDGQMSVWTPDGWITIEQVASAIIKHHGKEKEKDEKGTIH